LQINRATQTRLGSHVECARGKSGARPPLRSYSMPDPRTRSSFASRTAFDSLVVDSGEETDEEDQPVIVDQAQTRSALRPGVRSASVITIYNSAAEVQTKPSKLAQKKAARAARLEAKAQAKAAKLLSARSQGATTSGDDAPPAPRGPAPTSDQFPSETDGTLSASPSGDVSEPDNATTDLSANDAMRDPHEKRSMPSMDAPQDTTLHETTLKTKEAPNDLSRRGVESEVAAQKKLKEQDAESTKKRQNVLTRTLWTFIMIGGFIGERVLLLTSAWIPKLMSNAGLLLLGHAYMILLVLLCQTLVYREVTALFSIRTPSSKADDVESTGKDPWSKTLNWYFFAVTNYFLYGESIIYYFKVPDSYLCCFSKLIVRSMSSSQTPNCSPLRQTIVFSASRFTQSASSASSCLLRKAI
jgi:phosphatidate cytidylyltransferase